MKDWKNAVFWEGLPFLLLFGVFGALAAINWAYESKLLVPDQSDTDWSHVHLGQILLVIAFGLSSIGSAILLVVRLTWPGITSSLSLLVPQVLVAIFFILPSMFIVVLGPAAITMVQQMRVVPR